MRADLALSPTLAGALDSGDVAPATSLPWAGFLASRLLGIAPFARFDVDALLVGAAAVGTVGALVVVGASGRGLILAGAVLLGLGSGCVFPGIRGRLVDLDPSGAAAITGTALALTAVAGIAFPFVLGAVAGVVGIGSAAWLLPVTVIAALAALFAWRGYA